MKPFSTIAVGLLAISSSVVASPSSAAKPVDGSIFLPSFQSLTTSVKTYTGAINSTASHYSTLSTADKASALTSLESSASSINSLITSYTGKIPAIESGATSTAAPQAANAQKLASAVALLLEEINSSLNYAEAQTGKDFVITKRQIGVSIPLGTSLSNLVLALDKVVDNLLALVKKIVDELSTGLAGALSGLSIIINL